MRGCVELTLPLVCLLLRVVIGNNTARLEKFCQDGQESAQAGEDNPQPVPLQYKMKDDGDDCDHHKDEETS